MKAWPDPAPASFGTAEAASTHCLGRLGCLMFVEHQDAMRLEVVIAGESVAGEIIVHRLVKLHAKWRSLVIQQKINLCIVLLPHADLDIIRNLEQWLQIA